MAAKRKLISTTRLRLYDDNADLASFVESYCRENNYSTNKGLTKLLRIAMNAIQEKSAETDKAGISVDELAKKVAQQLQADTNTEEIEKKHKKKPNFTVGKRTT